MPGVASQEAVWIGWATPAGVCKAISSVLPGAAAGQRKSTRETETERIGTSIPLTLTTVPESSVVWPVVSDAARPSTNHLPSRLAIAPGLHAAASERFAALTTRVTTGVPESTSRRELAAIEPPDEPTSVKTTRWVPCEATSGTQSKSPETESKTAPAGRSEAERVATVSDADT